MTTVAEGNKRLLQLATHLESQTRGLDMFDFRHICAVRHDCGTSGCAMGEMPVLWPRQWAYTILDFWADSEILDPKTLKALLATKPETERGLAYRLMRIGRHVGPGVGTKPVQDWFAISDDAYFVLFEPVSDPAESFQVVYDLRRLPDSAKPGDVAAQLRAFVAARQKRQKRQKEIGA